VLIGIDNLDVVPLRSTFFHVIGDDVNWAQLSHLLSSGAVAWDGVLLEPISAEEGGPVAEQTAQAALRALEKSVIEDRLAINRGHFFDKWGRRLKVEEAQPQ
jgi:hypothetical protein